MTDDAHRQLRSSCLALLAACLAYAALVWPALHGPFVFDDFPNLASLAKVDGSRSARDLGIFLSEARSFPGRPLAMLSFLPQRDAWPDNPLPFKQVNLLIHLLNAALVFLLANGLVRDLLADHRRLRPWVAAIAATAWLVHPIQISTTMLVVQRMTLLCTFFTLGGLLAYVHAVRAGHLQPGRRALWLLAAIGGGTTLALLCKESGLLLPVYAWVLDATILRRDVDQMPRRLQILRRLLLFPVIGVIAAFLAWLVLHANVPLQGRDFTIAERLLTEPRVLFDYLTKILVPRYGEYGIYHDDFVLSRSPWQPWTTLPAIAGILAAAAAAVALRKRSPVFAFGVLWYLGGHAMESGPVALELYFDHRNYLPLAGPLIAAAIGLASMRAGVARRALRGAAAAWLLACLLSSALYARVWSDQARLAYFFSAEHPTSVRAQGELAETLFKAGRISEARNVLQASAQRQPTDVGPVLSLAFVDCTTGALTADDVRRLQTRLRASAWTRFGFEGLEPLRQQVVNGTCAPILGDRAWLALSDAVLGNPVFQSDPIAMGNLHYQRHLLAVARGNLDSAITELDETARHDPDPEIVRLQAKYLADAGLTDEAVRRLRRYDPSTRPLLRRLLVDDEAINRDAIAVLLQAAEPDPQNAH